MDLLKFSTARGNSVLVEVPATAGFDAAAAGDRIRDARRAFADGLVELADAADSALSALRGGALRPDSIEIEFGVRFTAESGLVVAKVATEGTLSVKMVWESSESQPIASPASAVGGATT